MALKFIHPTLTEEMLMSKEEQTFPQSDTDSDVNLSKWQILDLTKMKLIQFTILSTGR